MNGRKIQFIGRRFGNWTVVARDITVRYRKGNTQAKYICVCDCGNKGSVFAQSLRAGMSHKCADCVAREAIARQRKRTNGTLPILTSGTRLFMQAKQAAYERQRGLCALCLLPLPKEIGKSCYDHDHATGHFRGVVHQDCNTLLRFVENSPDLVSRAIQYLAKENTAQKDTETANSQVATGHAL